MKYLEEKLRVSAADIRRHRIKWVMAVLEMMESSGSQQLCLRW